MILETGFSFLKFISIDVPWLCLFLFKTNIGRLFRLIFPRQMKSLKREIILITGSANGLGREICLALGKSGATLVCWDIDKRRNEELVRRIRETGTNAYSYGIDISKPASIKATADKVKADVGYVSMIINNAGVFSLKSLPEYSAEEVENMFKINVMSHFWIIKEFLPDMINNKHGHIAAIASAACTMSPGLTSCYSSTKHAIHGLMESLRDEILRRDVGLNIKLTTAYPHLMRTTMSSQYKVNFRFPSHSKFLDPAYCAKVIVEGIRRDYEYIEIPFIRSNITKWIVAILPPKVLSALYSSLGITHSSVVDGNNGRATNDQLNKELY